MTHNSNRTVSRIITSVQTLEGEGFVVNRPFPSRALQDFDPFLLLDELGPAELGPGGGEGRPRPPAPRL